MWAPSITIYAITAAVLPHVLLAQQVGKVTPEVHPSLTSEVCTKAGGCATQPTKVVLDANWRWMHKHDSSESCFSSHFNAELCPDPKTCTKNCALDGANYKEDYGITTAGTELSLTFVTKSNRGSRMYLLQDDETYQHFKLLNREFTFDVDVSQLPCGMNGALYFVEMDADGGKARFPSNKAGAKFGTGYCDAQCPRDIKFINGEANMVDWTTAGSYRGSHGSCCQEMDVWEANSMATTYTPHTCSVDGQTRCTGDSCNMCDGEGCDFNPFRVGNQEFFGPGGKVDTKKPVTVVTRFVTDDNTDDGKLVAIQRWYVQGGKVIQNTNTSVSGVGSTSELTDKFCEQVKSAFSQTNKHGALGGLARMGEALRRGVVLTMSLWVDYAGKMHWLDSTLPANQPTAPGAKRGNCPTTGGSPDDLAKRYPDAQVKFSNIKVGEFGSTTTVALTPVVTGAPTPAPTPALVSTSDKTPTTTPKANTNAVNVSVEPTATPASVTNDNGSVATGSSATGAALPIKTAAAGSSNGTTNSPIAAHKDMHQAGGVTLKNQKQSTKRSANATVSPSPAATNAIVFPLPVSTTANPSAHKQYAPRSSNGGHPAGSTHTVISNKATPAPSPETSSVPVKNIGFNELVVRTPSTSSAVPGARINVHGSPQQQSPAAGSPQAQPNEQKPHQQTPGSGSPQPTASSLKANEHKPQQRHFTSNAGTNSNGPAGVRANGNVHSSQPASPASVSKLESDDPVRGQGKATNRGTNPACSRTSD